MDSSPDILKMPLKICVLNPDYTNSNSPLKGTDPPSDPRHYLPKDLPWTWHMAYIDKANSHQQIQALRKQKFDLFMNFCDGAADEDRAGEEVVRHLDYFNLPYVGCNHKFYTLSKKKHESYKYLS
jgi:D-alanine-D-alanine ligase